MRIPFRRALGVAALLLSVGGCAGTPVAYDSAGNPVVGTPAYGTPTRVAAAAVPTTGAVPYGAQCFAGFYQCPLAASVPIGSTCSCPGLGGPSFGIVR